MTLGELGSVGEFLAAIATLATLIYLALQIRQNTKTARASNYESVLNGLREFHALLAQDGEVADIYMRGTADLASLDPRERVRFNMLLYNAFTNYGVALHFYEQGMIQERLLRFFEEGYLAMLRQPGALEWWLSDDAKSLENWEYIERRRAA